MRCSDFFQLIIKIYTKIVLKKWLELQNCARIFSTIFWISKMFQISGTPTVKLPSFIPTRVYFSRDYIFCRGDRYVLAYICAKNLNLIIWHLLHMCYPNKNRLILIFSLLTYCAMYVYNLLIYVYNFVSSFLGKFLTVHCPEPSAVLVCCLSNPGHLWSVTKFQIFGANIG